MCKRDSGGLIAITVLPTRTTIGAGGTFALPQRAGRVRLVISVRDPGTVEVWLGALSEGRAIMSVTNPGPPVTLDLNHWGRDVLGVVTVYNGGGGPLTVDLAEHIEAL